MTLDDQHSSNHYHTDSDAAIHGYGDEDTPDEGPALAGPTIDVRNDQDAREPATGGRTPSGSVYDDIARVLQPSLAALHEEFEGLSQELDALHERRAALQEEIDSRKEVLQQLSDELSELEGRSETLEREQKAAADELDAVRREASTKARHQSRVQEELGEREEMTRQLDEQTRDIQERVNVLMQWRRQLQEQFGALAGSPPAESAEDWSPEPEETSTPPSPSTEPGLEHPDSGSVPSTSARDERPRSGYTATGSGEVSVDQWLERLRSLPEDAAEWSEVDHVLERLQRLKAEKAGPAAARAEEPAEHVVRLQAALDQVQSRRAVLDALHLDFDHWDPGSCHERDLEAAENSLAGLVQLLDRFQELEREAPASFGEVQRLNQRRAETLNAIANAHAALDGLLTGKGEAPLNTPFAGIPDASVAAPDDAAVMTASEEPSRPERERSTFSSERGPGVFDSRQAFVDDGGEPASGGRDESSWPQRREGPSADHGSSLSQRFQGFMDVLRSARYKVSGSAEEQYAPDGPPAAVAPQQASPPLVPVSRTGRVIIWTAALLFYGFGDTVTSLMVFQDGGSEANFLLGLVLDLIGPTIWGFLAVKAVTTLGALLVAQLAARWETVIAVLMLGIGAFLVANNLMALL